MVAADARRVGEPVDDLEGAGTTQVGSREGAAAELGDDRRLALVVADQAANPVGIGRLLSVRSGLM
jgi:hypothetical protein